MIVIKRRSALSAHPTMPPGTRVDPVAGAAAQLTLSERRPLSIYQVSAFPDAVGPTSARLATALELRTPSDQRYSGDSSRSMRVIGPGTWLIVGRSDAMPDVATLRATLAGGATVVDLSQARCALQLSGAAAARTLAKHCGLDLDGTRFPTGSATNTRLGPVGMHLARTDDRPTFELLVFRGYGEFVFEMLLRAATEFGLVVES